MADPPLIVLESVTKTYRMGEVAVPALRGVSVTIGKGEYVALMGPSGCGKTTLMNLIGCLDRPTAGRYLLEGEDVSQRDRDELARLRSRRMGFVFQSFNLLPRTTALENVELPLYYWNRLAAAERRERARRALARVGLAERAGHTPNRLSGGQQQRVAIARALVGAPPILLADEPTGNLDSSSEKEILAIFEELNREGITIVLVTHNKEVGNRARRSIWMRDGLIVEGGA